MNDDESMFSVLLTQVKTGEDMEKFKGFIESRSPLQHPASLLSEPSLP